jgi:hypothetical protein
MVVVSLAAGKSSGPACSGKGRIGMHGVYEFGNAGAVDGASDAHNTGGMHVDIPTAAGRGCCQERHVAFVR